MHKIVNPARDVRSSLEAVSAQINCVRTSFNDLVHKGGRQLIDRVDTRSIVSESIILDTLIESDFINASAGKVGDNCSLFDSDERDDWIHAGSFLEDMLEQK